MLHECADDVRLAQLCRVSVTTISTISLPLVLAAFSMTTGCAGSPIEAHSGESGASDPSDPDVEASSTGDASGDPTDDSDGLPTGPTGTTADPSSDSGTSAGADESDSTGAPTDVAQLRLVHAAAGAPNVDVYLAAGNEPVIVDLAYGSASEYLEVPAGTRGFDVREAGSPAGEPPLYTATLDLEADATITAIAAGSFASADEASAFRVLTLVEAFEEPGAGRTAVRFVNAGPDTAALNVDVGNDGSDPELPTVERFADSGVAGLPLPSDAELQLGIVSGGELLTAFTTPALAEGGNVFVIAAGLLDDLPREVSGFALLAVGPQGVIGLIRQNPIIYSLHASPDSGHFDICIGDAPRVVGQAFGDLTRLQLPPGMYDLEFYSEAGDCTGEPASIQPSGDLASGQQYLMVSAGEIIPDLGDQAFELLTFVEAFPLEAGPDAVFAVIHAASAPDVDVGTLDEGEQVTAQTLLVSDLAWAQESEFVTIPAGDYTLGVVPASMPLPAAPYGIIAAPMAQRMRAWTVAAGDVAPQGFDHLATIFTVVTNSNPWTVVAL